MVAKSKVTFIITARDRASRVLRALTNRLRSIRLGLGSLVAGIGFGRLTQTTLSWANSLTTANERLGVTAQTFQALSKLGTDVGSSTQNVATVLQRIGRRQGEVALGNEPLTEALTRLGISADEFAKSDVEDALFALIGAQENIDPAKWKALVAQLVDVEGLALLSQLSSLGNVEEIRKELERLKDTVTVDDATIQSLSEVWRNVREQALKARVAIAGWLASQIREIDLAARALRSAVEFITGGGLKEAAADLTSGLPSGKDIGEFAGFSIRKLLGADELVREFRRVRDAQPGAAEARRPENQQMSGEFTRNAFLQQDKAALDLQRELIEATLKVRDAVKEQQPVAGP